MSVKHIETDYLVIGAGAMALAFADEVIMNDPDAHITFVDRRRKPGGHWNDAYSFVQLHQPSCFYGVNSTKLGKTIGEQAYLPEIMSYFENVLESMIARGQATFLSECNYHNGDVVPLNDKSTRYKINIKRKLVDSTYMNVEVPSTHKPNFKVSPHANFIPPNDIPNMDLSLDEYVIIGAGKTSMDSALHLLKSGVHPGKITWAISNDMWIWCRDFFEPHNAAKEVLEQLKVFSRHPAGDAAFLKLEEKGVMMRFDQGIRPTKWRCATASTEEFNQLQRISNIVRQGRVSNIKKREITFEDGATYNVKDSAVFINCTANGAAKRAIKPIFEQEKITLQSVMMCQQVFSAAVIGKLETMNLTDQQRNEMWAVVPHPEQVEDAFKILVSSFENLVNANSRMMLWLRKSRLNAAAHTSLIDFIKNAVSLTIALPKAKKALKTVL